MKNGKSDSHTGIWIDTRNADIISVSSSGSSFNSIASDIVTKEREDGEKGNQGRIGDQFLDPEKGRHQKLEEQTKMFLKHIIELIRRDDSFVIFGPSSMKIKLEKEIQKHKDLAPKIDGVETADSMTENQKVAWVRDYYKTE